MYALLDYYSLGFRAAVIDNHPPQHQETIKKMPEKPLR